MTDSDIHRLHVVRRAKTLFARLAGAGCERDTAGNRTLLYSHYASLVLLSLFNPVMQSVRGIQAASGLKKVQKQLGTGRVSLGSLSESTRVFDPALLVPLIEELLADLPASHPGPGPRRHVPDSIPRELADRLVVADGSALAALPHLVRAAAGGDWKLHLQFRPLDGRPHALHLAREYADDERDVLRGAIEPGCVYLADRGYEQYALYNAIVAAKSDYVIRGQDRPAVVVEERLLTAAAVAARVVSDEVVRLTASARTAAALDHPVRRVVIAGRDRGRRRTDRTNADEVILYTSRLDPPAEVLAAVYELRWSIELFFRFLKQVLGLKRLFSDKPEAVAIQVYCAVIACLLLAHAVGGRVTADAYRMLSFYLQGWADDEELRAFLTKLREREA
jgi:hypothetical protein